VVDLKKQSQFQKTKVSASVYLTKIYGKNSMFGPLENKAKFKANGRILDGNPK